MGLMASKKSSKAAEKTVTVSEAQDASAFLGYTETLRYAPSGLSSASMASLAALVRAARLNGWQA